MLNDLDFSLKLSNLISSIYFHCHPKFQVELSHQAVRTLQLVQMEGPVSVQQIAEHLGCAQNTASEIVRRLREKGFVEKNRREGDERVVEVTLTEAGDKTVLEHTGLDVERLAKNLSQVAEVERERFEQILTRLLEIVSDKGSI